MRVLRGLTFEKLPCGCLGGVYETYRGDVVTLLDARASECRNDAHTPGALLRRVRATHQLDGLHQRAGTSLGSIAS